MRVVEDPFADHNSGHSSPTETLPDYLHIERPTQPLIYSFVTWDPQTVYLLPPRAVDPGRGPIYTISVALNLAPFVPLSYITTVRRGSDPDGEFVGEFELGVRHKRATVMIGARATRMSNVLQNERRSPKQFRWVYEAADLRWDCRTALDDGSPMCICADASSHQLASFVPPPLDASPPLPEATLTVFPDGHRFFDHILLSALVVERKMTLSF
ncbi:hypothetical protein B0H21DRAFT_780603 [Amylocystis lapponica]|nr:hypothetical protein B0H21DRAFT_780603 [Amylocystis lapponica]